MHKLQISDIKKDPELSLGSHLGDDVLRLFTSRSTTIAARGAPVACPTRPCVRSGGHRRQLPFGTIAVVDLNMKTAFACVNTHFEKIWHSPFSLSHFAEMLEHRFYTSFLAVC
jgi:hypothetical protein